MPDASWAADGRGSVSDVESGSWTFLTSHARVLLIISQNPDIRARDIASIAGITERSTQRIVADLEAAGYLSHERIGRRNHYRVSREAPLRHPHERNVEIGALLELSAKLGSDSWDGSRSKSSHRAKRSSVAWFRLSWAPSSGSDTTRSYPTASPVGSLPRAPAMLRSNQQRPAGARAAKAMASAEQMALKPRTSGSAHHQQRMAIQRIEELQDRSTTQGQPVDVESSRPDPGKPIKGRQDLVIRPVHRGGHGRHPQPRGNTRRYRHRQMGMRPATDRDGSGLDVIESDLARHNDAHKVKTAQSGCHESVDAVINTEPSEISRHRHCSRGGEQTRHFGATRAATPRHPSKDPLKIRPRGPPVSNHSPTSRRGSSRTSQAGTSDHEAESGEPRVGERVAISSTSAEHIYKRRSHSWIGAGSPGAHAVLTARLLRIDTDSVRIEDDRLVVTPLSAETPDPELERLRSSVSHVLPEVGLVDLLVEVNSGCGFLDIPVHAGHSTDRRPDHAARLLAAVVANGCNFGLATMARIAGFTADELTWTQDWYLRSEIVRAGNDRIVNHQIRQPIAQLWGTGTLSSSDGQRFPMVASSPRARAMRRYFTGSGATIYTWTSDRHAQYGTRIIPTTVREATYVLDAIFDNETDLDIEEHTTDTAGYTDLVFGLFDLTGLTFSPRIRDLADQRLWRLPSTGTDGPAAALLQHRINPPRFIDRWDDMLRVATTIRHGYLPASLVVSRLQASARQNQLTRAIQEHGRIIKTISILRYLHDGQHRRRIHAQLNKGESLHARRQLFFANQGQIRRRRSDDQDLQGECLTLLTNAVVCWNTIYTQAAVEHLASGGAHVRDEHLARLSPAGHDHINLYGRYDFTNPTRLPHGRLRPLRT